MSSEVIVWILIILLFGVGVYALQGAIRNSFKEVELKKAQARILREIIGQEGYRWFVGILGSLFLIVSLAAAIAKLGGFKIDRNNAETDTMIIEMRSEEANTTSSLWTTEAQLQMKFDVIGDREFDTYQSISLKNNYRNTFPPLLWRMKNLESIDLTNNEFSELPLEKFKSLPLLKTLILDGNPIDLAYLEQVRSALQGVEVIKNDISHQ